MNFKNVKTETWVRTTVLVVALLNQILQMMGIETLPFTNDQLANGITNVFTIIAALWAWWKNNSFTHKAQKVDESIKKR